MKDLSDKQRTLQKHLQIAVKACLELQPNIIALILYGGFGRDEGSWYKDEQGYWRPYNDYDICMVTKRKSPVREVKALEKFLAKKIGINWVDLSQLSLSEMRRLRPSIKNYDLKNASKVIYGDITVLDVIPEIDASKLPMKEAETLFVTRLYTIIGSMNGKGLSQNMEGEASRFFRNQMAKAVLAVVDVLLLAKSAYDASYRRRVERLEELYSEKEEFIELSQWALAEKLQPLAPIMRSEEISRLYEVVHKHYLSEMYCGVGAYFGRGVKGPDDIEFCMKWLPVAIMKRLYWLIKFRGLRMERHIAVMLAQSYLAAAWSRDGINEKWLSRGVDLLRCADALVPQQIQWDRARLEAAHLRMEV